MTPERATSERATLESVVCAVEQRLKPLENHAPRRDGLPETLSMERTAKEREASWRDDLQGENISVENLASSCKVDSFISLYVTYLIY